jgi:ribulose-phosphate 3-epimerase
MLAEPDRYLDAFLSRGARMVSVHVEVLPSPGDTLARIRACGALAGIAINPATLVGVLEPVARLVDFVVVMSVNPGFSGQRKIEGSEDKVRAVRSLLRGRGSDAAIEIDGGVDATNIRGFVEAGADIAVGGSSVFKHPGGAAAGLRALRAAACAACLSQP